MAAGAGQDKNGNVGGEGGKSEFIITLEQNQEYVVKLGSTSAPTGGANGGGGSAVLYKKARVIVALGGGGGAGTSTKGGKGGGIGLAGENGTGRDGGAGGDAIATGNYLLVDKTEVELWRNIISMYNRIAFFRNLILHAMTMDFLNSLIILQNLWNNLLQYKEDLKVVLHIEIMAVMDLAMKVVADLAQTVVMLQLLVVLVVEEVADIQVEK